MYKKRIGLSLSVIVILLVGCGENTSFMNKIKSLDFSDEARTSELKHSRSRISAYVIKADKLWSEPYNLNGNGITVGVVDRGKVNVNHIEFSGRVTNVSKYQTDKTSSHSTQVAGVIGATGKETLKIDYKYYDNNNKVVIEKNKNLTAHGMANLVKIRAYSNAKINGGDALRQLARDGILLSNHSYGKYDSNKEGIYDTESYKIDLAIYDNPYILGFFAAGNEGGKTLPKGNSKNIFTIGNVKDGIKSKLELTVDSKIGPTNDGRIKPDFVANGSSLLTPSYNDGTKQTYIYANHHENESNYIYAPWAYGTSFACPSATGTVALLVELYNKVNHTKKIRADELKAILANTAEDLGNKGPDYRYGFGLINALEAAKVIESMKSKTSSLVYKGEIFNDDTDIYPLIITENSTPFKATISWIDKAANINLNKYLINDIDIEIIKESDGTIYRSYTLDKNNPSKSATRQGNHLDNTEQIEAILSKGNYLLSIKGHKISSGGQKYTLVTNKPLTKEITRNSVYDGSGSLINANDECWGCNKDEADMHPHPNATSSVSFQWIYDAKECHHIDISTNKYIDGGVSIYIKGWYKNEPQIIYEASLPIRNDKDPKEGLSIETNKANPSQNDVWNTILVTTNQPLNEDVEVYAYCRKISATQHTNSKNRVSKEIPYFENHHWTGNGSLISITNNPNTNGFGYKHDYALIPKLTYSTTAFQWYKKDSCNTIKLSLTNNEEVLVDTKIKRWNKTQWNDVNCYKLPCVISSSYNGYLLVKIENQSLYNSKSFIKAECIKK